MIEPAGSIAPPRSAAHDEYAHRRLRLDAVRDPLGPAVEPASPQGEEILGEIAVDRSRRAEIDIASIAERAVAMRPRTEDQPHRTASAARQTEVIFDRRARIRIIPPRKIDDRDISVTVVIAFGIDPGPLPEFVEGPVGPLH